MKDGKRNALERAITEGDNPVRVTCFHDSVTLSRAGHEESCLNLPGPSGKAKYSLVTDSERVQ